MHHKKVKITDSFIITGRGKVYITNLDFDKYAMNFNSTDTFRCGDKILEIKSVEAILKTDGENRSDYVSFIAKEITPKEFLSKISVKDTSTMKAVRRRIKYRFFIRIWQNIVLKFLVIRDKIFNT